MSIEALEKELGFIIEKDLLRLQPGERYCYHRGFLAYDCGSDEKDDTYHLLPNKDRIKYKRLRDFVQALYLKGKITLLQKRTRNFDGFEKEYQGEFPDGIFEYIAVGLPEPYRTREQFYVAEHKRTGQRTWI